MVSGTDSTREPARTAARMPEIRAAGFSFLPV